MAGCTTPQCCVDEANASFNAALAQLIIDLTICVDQSWYETVSGDITEAWKTIKAALDVAGNDPDAVRNIFETFAYTLSGIDSAYSAHNWACWDAAWGDFEGRIDAIRDALLDCLSNL